MATINCAKSAFSTATGKHFLDYGRGDQDSYNLICGTLYPMDFSKRIVNPLLLQKTVELSRLYLVVCPKSYPLSLITKNEIGPEIVPRIAMQRQAKKLFDYGEFGMFSTSILMNSIIDGIHLYFKSAKLISKSKAFSNYQDSVKAGEKFRLMLLKQNLSQNWEMPNYRRFRKAIFRYQEEVDILENHLGLFVNAHRFYCGDESLGRDNLTARRLRRCLKASKSMFDFVNHIYAE